MRVVAIVLGLVVVGLGVIVLRTNVFQPPPAGERLAGVRVGIAGYTIDALGDGRHRLKLTVTVEAAQDLDECVAFTLDQQFAGRRLEPVDGQCVRPSAGRRTVALAFDQLTDDDLAFPSHTLVWGVAGGRCGPILEVVGVCVVDMAGTTPLELPSRSVLPSLGPIGSFFPIFPTFSFSP